MQRFSEDIDLSLLQVDEQFDFQQHLKAIVIELESFGFDTTVQKKEKTSESKIDSAFLKATTLTHLVKLGLNYKTHKNRKIKIKIEVDTTPPPGFSTEVKYQLAPIPFSVRTMTLPSLFAGKIHAVLCRERVWNVKGRDWYDFIWYVQQGVQVDLSHLRERMLQTGHLIVSDDFNHNALVNRLTEKANATDFEQAKRDVAPFLKNPKDRDQLQLWSADFFCEGVIGRLESVK